MEEIIENQEKKAKISKKIWSIVMLCVASLLVVAMIVVCFVPKSFAPLYNKPSYVKVYTSNNDGVVYNKNTDEYEKIMTLFKDSFKVTIMDALLDGYLAENGEYVEKYQYDPKSSGSYAIELCYDEEQKINSSYKGTYKTYLSVVVVVIQQIWLKLIFTI